MDVKELTKDEIAALRFLASCGGGFTAGTIARNCGRARDRIDIAGFRSAVLGKLYRAGRIDRIDRETPHVYVITDAGRALLRSRAPTIPEEGC